jgi:hypothetical protein
MAAMATTPACGDDGVQTKHDAAVDSTTVDVAPDADLDIAGTWIDRYVSTSGTAMVSMCTVAPTGTTIDTTTAATTAYPGTCKPNGSFRIMAPNLGTYYLRLANSFYETNKRTGLDFATDHLGRSDVIPASGVTLNMNTTNMAPWVAGDAIYAFSSNIGYSQLVSFTTGAPNNGDTALNSATAPWTGYKVESGKSDGVMLLQVGAHTTSGGLPYTSLDRSLDAAPFTMANNSSSTINGPFATPAAASLQLRIDSASFNTFEAAVNPAVSGKTLDGSLFATISTDAKGPPPMLSFSAPTNGVALLSYGTLSYGDPFPSSWERLVRVQAVFQVPYTYAAITTSRGATMTRVVTRATADAGVINAIVGPPVAPKLDDGDAFTATNISTVPKVSWTAPALDTPTDYEVQVYEVAVNGSALKYTSVLRLTTKQTSVRIPAGILLGQRPYVFSITARIRQGVDIYTTPLQAGDTSASAETLSALVTTGT